MNINQKVTRFALCLGAWQFVPARPGHVVEGGSMARTNRIRKNAADGIRLLSGLFIILVLACGAQTGNNGSQPEPQQKSAQSGIKRSGRT